MGPDWYKTYKQSNTHKYTTSEDIGSTNHTWAGKNFQVIGIQSKSKATHCGLISTHEAKIPLHL